MLVLLLLLLLLLLMMLLVSVCFVELGVSFEFTFDSICTVRPGGRETGILERSLFMRGVVDVELVEEVEVTVVEVFMEPLLKEE